MVLMSWDKFLYGTHNIPKYKKFFLKTLLLGSLLSVYGIWTDFVPSECWLYFGLIITILLSVIVLSYTLWKKLTVTQQQFNEIEDWRKILGYIIMPFIFFGVM